MAINFSNYRLGQLPYWTNVSLVKGVLEQIFPLTTKLGQIPQQPPKLLLIKDEFEEIRG